MTIAVDIRTGKVLGQLVSDPEPISEEELQYLFRAGVQWERIVAMRENRHLIRVLTHDGYRNIPSSSVRLEDVA